MDNHKKNNMKSSTAKELSDISEDDTNSNDNKCRQKSVQETSIDKKPVSLINKTDEEDELDFEEEEGECSDIKEVSGSKTILDVADKGKTDLEEGEVTDEDEHRPEENDTKPVCRFYTRGQCTWGISCRFLHPGVTDKGNYTMFDMVRPVNASNGFGSVYQHDAFRDFRAHSSLPQPGSYLNIPNRVNVMNESLSESAWERGLRTAKEMMRKANKRKEQDIDFEDKKMNLSLSQDELDKDNYYTKEMSPSEAYTRLNERSSIYIVEQKSSHDDKFYGRSSRYRMRDISISRATQHDEIGRHRLKPSREVIVQRAEDWNDPWMRKKSPLNSLKRQSYSSHSSYSDSSSSSSSLSETSSGSTSSTSLIKLKRQSKNKSDNERNSFSKKLCRSRPPLQKRISQTTKTSSPKYSSSKSLLPVYYQDHAIQRETVSTVSKKRSHRKVSESSSETSCSSPSESDSTDETSSKSSIKNIRTRDVAFNERKTASIKKAKLGKE